ncbi:Hypothetical protein CINCED_3A012367 [Cinara cedri]|uniref:Uncharacterized protein n=1 Tax=Cinara cedri TaxID=506608 RepID=A0A5E4NJ41_9HEMI|nr:Hypothetical protein CINCED_3A012367 [Cinara cedri]
MKDLIENELREGIHFNQFIIEPLSRHQTYNLSRSFGIREQSSIEETLAKNLKSSTNSKYLASEDSMVSIMYSFRNGKSTISKLLFECCTALWKILNSKAFSNKGSTSYNYKRTHSIVLMAMCDASYNFTLVDVGAPGRCKIDSINGPIPYYAIVDKALLVNLMRRFPSRRKTNLPLDESVFNYRLIYNASDINNIQNHDWRQNEIVALPPIDHIGPNMHSRYEKITRNQLKDYFSSEGAVPFHYNRILR